VSQSTDVLVIGGGIVGAATAYELARRGRSVTLLEADELASGATGRNLGYVWLHTRRIGPELDLVMATRRRLEELPEELEADFGLRTRGGLIFYNRPEQAQVLREFVEQRMREGLEMQLLSGDDAREVAPILPESVLGASYCPLDAQIDSRRYVQAFARAAQRSGATIIEGKAVRSFDRRDGRVDRVITDAGVFTAGSIVLAAGAWTPFIGRQLGLDLPIHSMRLQIIRTEPMPPRLEHLLYGPAAVKQYSIFQELPSFAESVFASEIEDRHGLALLEAACQSADGSYLLGCAMDYPGFDWHPDLAGIALVSEGLQASLPELRGARFAAAWAGVLPFTADNLPLIGRVPGFDDVVIAAGHVFGNGAGPTTGRLVAELLCDEPASLDLEPFRPDRGSLRSAVEQSVW
jgi:glycine/D-amino acid oxidase-like deaminating enzyme